MYQSLERPMTENDRQKLLGCLPLTPSPFSQWPFKKRLLIDLSAILTAILVCVGIKKIPAIFVVPATAAFLALYWLANLNTRVLNPLRRWRETNDKIRKFYNSINAAKSVRVCSVEANTVVEVFYDDGTICLFDIGNKQTIWVDPNCMIPGCDPQDWPNQKFETITVPGIDEEFGPFCSGKLLHPKETFEFRDLFEHNEFVPPPDGIINQSLNDFLRVAKAQSRLVENTEE
jgi:hypothetical protein